MRQFTAQKMQSTIPELFGPQFIDLEPVHGMAWIKPAPTARQLPAGDGASGACGPAAGNTLPSLRVDS
jgi:hypothetical protein